MSLNSNTIMIVDNYRKSSQLYALGLEAYVGSTVVEFATIEEAVDYLEAHTPRIIITRGNFDQRDAGLKFSQLIQSNKLPTDLIVIGKTKISIHEAVIFEEDIHVREIIKKCASILGVTAKAMAEKDVGDFYPIRLELLCPNLVLICPVFKKNLEGSYEKFLEKDHKIHPEILVILQSSGDKYIYVEAINRLKFVNSITLFMTELMADDRLSLEDSILLANNSYSLIRESARNMMISPVIIQATESNINTMLSIIGKIPKLNQFLKMTTSDISPVFRHSLLTCFIASHITTKMEWGTNEQRLKIAFVCFFSNLMLTNDEYLFIHTDDALSAMDIDKTEKDSIHNHALNAAKLLGRYYTSLPFGVDTIIKQHHGNRYGQGFSQNPSIISPLALIYMIADEWVTLVLRNEKLNIPLNQGECINAIKLKYKGVMFQEIIKALDDLAL